MKQQIHTGNCRPLSIYLILTSLSALFTWFVSTAQQINNDNADKLIGEMVAKINTQTDPQFIYEYQQSKFVPPHGKTLLIMGQTEERINEYMDHFQNQPIPGGWAAYWGIPEFAGITEAHRNETGSTQNHQMLIEKFPNTVLQSAMWMVGKWEIAKKTGQGDYDKVITKYAQWAKAANRPIYLRIGYEFDGAHNELDPNEYIIAYKHVVDLLRKKGADNIAFVWHSYAAKPFKDYALSAWYPGDEYVDWVAISVFDHAYAGSNFGPYCDDVLQFAKDHKKPVMIAESNPIKGIAANNVDAWNQWFVNFFSFAYNKNIKAISFINENWQRTNIAGIADWKDARLYNNKQIAEAWFEETKSDRYLKQSDMLYEQLGFGKE